MSHYLLVQMAYKDIIALGHRTRIWPCKNIDKNKVLIKADNYWQITNSILREIENEITQSLYLGKWLTNNLEPVLNPEHPGYSW